MDRNVELSCDELATRLVALIAGAWIETENHKGIQGAGGVALIAGAWIETIKVEIAR